MNNYGNFCYCFEIFTETLEQNIRKSHKICFQTEKKTNKAKLEIFKFFRKSVFRKAIAFDKNGGNYALPANSIKICLLRYFCMQNSYLR